MVVLSQGTVQMGKQMRKRMTPLLQPASLGLQGEQEAWVHRASQVAARRRRKRTRRNEQRIADGESLLETILGTC